MRRRRQRRATRLDSLRFHADRLRQLELQARFSRQLQMLFARGGNRGAGDAADESADRRALPSAGNAANDGTEARAAADLAGRSLALTFARHDGVLAGHLIDLAA